MDQPGVAVDEAEVHGALSHDVHEAGIAGDKRLAQAGGELHGVEYFCAGDGEIRAHAEHAIELELAGVRADPADQIQGMDHLAGHTAGGAVVVDTVLAPMEAGPHQLPVVTLDPLTQLLGCVRVALHQVQGKAADLLQCAEQHVQVVIRRDQRLLAEHEAPVSGQLLEDRRMAVVVDADHNDVWLEHLQRPNDAVEVGQLGRLLPAPDIGQRQRQAGARGDMLEGAAVAVASVAQADDQDLHAKAS
ncbi:hypothetical protein D9M71_525630 [compost metagenome]